MKFSLATIALLTIISTVHCVDDVLKFNCKTNAQKETCFFNLDLARASQKEGNIKRVRSIGSSVFVGSDNGCPVLRETFRSIGGCGPDDCTEVYCKRLAY